MARNDHFSGFAATYAAHRPTYPESLYTWLAAQTPARHHAWDCATGTGQAALSLAQHFARVTATDVGEGMIAHAAAHPRVTYAVAPAEEPPSDLADVDLITVAQALHWFDRDAFWTACHRVLKPGGVLAFWGYLLPDISHEVNTIVALYHDITVGPYWPPDRGPLLNGYTDVVPPDMERLAPPAFDMAVDWTVENLIGMLDSWSATHRARQATGEDPLAPLVPELRAAWGTGSRRVTWPIPFHAFRR